MSSFIEIWKYTFIGCTINMEDRVTTNGNWNQSQLQIKKHRAWNGEERR